MGDFQNFKFEDPIPDLSPETQLNLRKLLQVAGIENVRINDGRRISDTEVLNEIRKEVAMLSRNENEYVLTTVDDVFRRTASLIPACINGDDEVVKTLLPSGDYDVNEITPDGETALTCAVSANAFRIVEMLLKHGADPNFRGKKVECTPLMEAASVGYTYIVRLLLAYGADVDQKSKTGNTALHYAATSGHLECVCLLLQYNSSMEVQNETGHTPLMEATSNGHIDVARCLIKHGCNINTHSTEFKESALTLASYKGHAEMVRFLLEAGADHEHRTDEMHTALMEAAMEGHVEVARLLLAHGANVNIPQDSFESPLTLAACGGHAELAHLLIGYGADIEEVNDEGYTPLMEAAREGHEETVALLLAVGADVNARTEETQETALTLAACGGFIEVCEMLLNAGADIEVGGVGCSTPLMEAAQEGHLELVRRLLQRGASVNAVTATGDTALHYAAENGHVKVCEELLEWGAVFEAMTEGGRTPLMKAAQSGNLEVVQLFLKHGTAIDQPTAQNDANALSLACSGGHAKVVRFLLQHGANPQYQLRDGSTMLIEAARSGSPAVLRLILDYPRCLTHTPMGPPPSAAQLLTGDGAQLQQLQQQQLQLLQQRQLYQTLSNGAQSPLGNTPNMPPPPPPPPSTPLSVTGTASVDNCMDPSHTHLHAHQHSMACQHAHQALSFQAPTSTLAVSVSQPPPTHLDAALVNAYAVGWADGAASLVHQQQQLTTTTTGDVQSSTDAGPILCSQTNTLLTHSIDSPVTCITTHTASMQQVLPLKSLPTTMAVQSLRNIMGSACTEAQLSQCKALLATGATVADSLSSIPLAVSSASSTTANSMNNLSCSSSTSSGSSASSMVPGTPVDSAEEIGAGLLQALFQDFMPDKEELIRRFEAVMCPYNRITQHPTSPNSCATVAAMANTPAAITLSRLVDPQQNCQRPTATDNTGVHGRPTPPYSAELLSKVFKGSVLTAKTVLDEPSDDTESAMSVHEIADLKGVDRSELFDPINMGSSTSNTTPILSSCHSSSSAISTPECSTVSVGAADSVCIPVNASEDAAGPASPMTSYDYENEKDVLTPGAIGYLSGTTDAMDLAAAQSIFHESANIDHEMLASCRHYHPPGPHMACALDVSAAAAAVASLSHSTTHAGLHHHHLHARHHHPLAVPGSADGLITPGALLHIPPHPASALSVDALLANPALGYDPATALAAHSMQQQQAAGNVGGTARVLPIGSAAAMLNPAHVLAPTDLPVLNGSGTAESVASIKVPSLIDVNACIESSMETALTLACHGGFVELVRLLVERGADREHRDKKSHTPLHTAVYANQRPVIALLLDYGAEIEAQVDRTKDTALSIACSHGHLEIVEELLERGANKEHRNISDYTPLSLAASSGHIEVIQLLLRYGAEINSRTGSKLGISPLMLASMNGHTNAVRLLLEHGSDINAHIETNRNTALTLACFQGRHAVVSLLVERKANIEHRAKTGLTPLMEAASGDYVEVGMILLDHGADVNASPVPSSRDTALTIAADKGNAKFVNLLLAKGAVVESRNKKGATPLWLACNGGHFEVVQSLIQYNADVNSQDNRKVSCLMAAFRKGHVSVVGLLVQYVTQFPSDKDCSRHIKTVVTDKELAERCQQCREIIIAAKEKQEGEARKNANCLLEQIELEEEERANREAMQARKRERKRMKRKAKQDKEREVKPMPSSMDHNGMDETNGHISPTSHNSFGDQDGISSEQRSPTLSQAVEHFRKGSFDSQRSMGSGPDIDDQDAIERETMMLEAVTAITKPSSPPKHAASAVVTPDFITTPSVQSSSPVSIANKKHSTNTTTTIPATGSFRMEPVCEVIPFAPTVASLVDHASTTEAKREKHRNKKQSQRAVKRAIADSVTSAESDKLLTSISLTTTTTTTTSTASSVGEAMSPSHLPVTSAYYAVTANGDGEVNWNAVIDSQSAHLNRLMASVTTPGTESNWTMVLPSSSTRTQRSGVQSRTTTTTTTTTDVADWKTSSSSSGSTKRRLSIPVSRHDIGKVIGQGGAVVSALRNMSGIQIDIESARSDEVTERMVYLKGPSDAVQKTYETIQGLLNGTIPGSELLVYAALKKTSSLSSAVTGKAILSALSLKASGGAVTVTTSSTGVTKTSSSRGTSSGKATRKSAKVTTSTTPTTVTSTSSRPAVVQPTTSISISRTTGLTAKVAALVTTCSNSNNNSTTASSSSTALSSATNGTAIMSTRVASTSTSSWSSKVSSVSASTKGNFASVAAAGLSSQPRVTTKVVSDNVPSKGTHGGGAKYAAVPNLMSTFPTVPVTTAPVSLLSLNVGPFSASSQLFPDLALSFSVANDVAPDSLDEVSFPPLNPKATRSSTTVSSSEDKEAPSSPPVSTSNIAVQPINLETTYVPTSHAANVGSTEAVQNTIIPPSSVSPETPLETDTVTSALMKPLTVSPSIGTIMHTSQPATPVGSGGSLAPACAGTPPTTAMTTTHVRSFARAPGSERSAQQRGVNVSAGNIAISLSDNFPGTLMPLNGNPASGVTSDPLSITPTKRAVSTESHDPEFQNPAIPSRFRNDTESDWPESNTATSQASCLQFSKSHGFSLDPHTGMELMNPNVSTDHQSKLGLDTSSTHGIGKTQHPIDPLRPSAIVSSWPMQPATDLNPNAIAFEPSAFQPPGAVTTHHITMQPNTTGSTSLASSALLSTDYSDISAATLSHSYVMDPSLSGALRQTNAHAPTKQGNLSHAVHSLPGVPMSGLGSSTVPSSAIMMAAKLNQNCVAPTVTRAKPLLSVTPNAYADTRGPLMNGYGNSVNPPSQSLHTQTMPNWVPNAQLHNMFSTSTAQQQQQTSHMTSSSMTHQQQAAAVAASRLGGSSPHSLLNQNQMTMGCPNVSGGSYTPPPCMSAFMQPAGSNHAVASHPGSSYSTHLLNGTGSTVPVHGTGGSLHHQPSSMQPVPIGAERRRQAATTLSSTGSIPPGAAGSYATSTSNGNGPVSFGFGRSMGMTNPSSGLHQSTPQQPQQAANNPNMLMFMNMVQQQQQQQQHLGLGNAGTSHPSANWQPPSMWQMSNSYATTNATSGKYSSSQGMTDLSGYANSPALFPSGLSSNSNSSTGNSQQQLVAAMAAMGVCQWNAGGTGTVQSGGAGTTVTPVVNPVAAGQLPPGSNRWMHPSQGGSAYATSHPYYPDPLQPPPTLKPQGATGPLPHPSIIHHPQPVHRPHE